MKIFDSRDAEYRRPFGALPAGTPLELTFKPPREWGAQRVLLVAQLEDEQRTLELPMTWRALQLDHDVYTVTLPTDNLLGLVWYSFRVERGDRAPVYYGDNPRRKGGEGSAADHAIGYQLTVYDAAFKVPSWYGKGITYHIFPDRFARAGELPDVSGMVGHRVLHKSWDEAPEFLPNEQGEVLNNDFFGGNIAGIIQKLDYLQSLGVSTIYLSPIFEAASNHRYDTADYHAIDPLFGNEMQFKLLCAEAKQRNMKIILDGVFNHTGCDSRYFNARGTYSDMGAYQSQQSPYIDWYDFKHWPDVYDSWWNFYTLPHLNKNSLDLCRFLFESKDSVLRKWLRLGASGWRLDVVDELPNDFVVQLRAAVKEQKKDAILIGEVWEDASNKVAYGQRRRYFFGDELDGVMNYPLRDALIAYLLGGSAQRFVSDMESLRENYPKPVFYSLMNCLGTHDTPRILTVLGATAADYALGKPERALHRLSPDQRALAFQRLKLASLVIYCFPGSPCLYYGDEAGLEGFEDPFNRRTYPWGHEDEALLAHYRRLGQLRTQHRALRDGELVYHNCGDAVLCFTRGTDRQALTLLVNNSDQAQVATLPWTTKSAFDMLTPQAFTAEDDAVTLTVQPYGALLLSTNQPHY